MYRKETRSENEALRHSTVRWNSPKKEVEKGKDWEFRISKCELLYLEWVKNKVLLQGTRNYIQYLMVNHNVKE